MTTLQYLNDLNNSLDEELTEEIKWIKDHETRLKVPLVRHCAKSDIGADGLNLLKPIRKKTSWQSTVKCHMTIKKLFTMDISNIRKGRVEEVNYTETKWFQLICRIEINRLWQFHQTIESSMDVIYNFALCSNM